MNVSGQSGRLQIARYIWGWRIANWRCWLFGHRWGEEQDQYELQWRYESWVECERCGYAEVTWSVYGGQTQFGLSLEARLSAAKDQEPA